MSDQAQPSTNGSLSRAFSRLGWIGFWLQLAMGTIPIALLIYAALFGDSNPVGTRAGFGLIEYLTIGSLLVLGFTGTRESAPREVGVSRFSPRSP
jgi:hypothetical protein